VVAIQTPFNYRGQINGQRTRRNTKVLWLLFLLLTSGIHEAFDAISKMYYVEVYKQTDGFATELVGTKGFGPDGQWR
jgi:hypothetical protein